MIFSTCGIPAWKNVHKVENAFFIRVTDGNHTCWQHQNYKIGGPVLSVEGCKDRNGTSPRGRFSTWIKKADSTQQGLVVEGKLHGTWYLLSDAATVVMTKSIHMESCWLPGLYLIQKKRDKMKLNPNSPDRPGIRSRYLIKNL